MTPPTNVRATWYLLAVIPVALGALIAIMSLRGMADTIERMPRVVVPGKGELALEAGDHVAYGETRSELDGTVYLTSSLQLRCNMVASPGGEAVELTAPTAATNYGVGGFQGQSMFTLTIPRAGTYELACDGEGGPATIAVGPGIGAAIGITLGSMLGGAAAMVAVIIVVRRRRRRARAASQATEPAPPAPPR
jgi:hypothetical protein